MPAGYNPEDENPVTWPKLPSTLWNHMAMAIESVPNDYMFIFGGQKSPREFSNLVSVLHFVHDFDEEAGTHGLSITYEPTAKWSLNPHVAPPPAREDAGCAYDPTESNLVFFGGWRQKWWNDLALLNVAGVVGPPYAVHACEPNTGPVTGLTPITIRGMKFKESPIVSVRFTDGKKSEMTVSGTWVSETEIKCKSPDFSKFGAYDVIVRVSIGGDPFTVSETHYSFYSNTSAKKCVCFGPGLKSGNPAGQLLSFMVQCKDVSGKLRTTGDDPLDMKLVGPAQDLVEKPEIVDLQNGTYVVNYYVPSAGTYELVVGVDENPYDDEVLFTTIRGFPVQRTYSGAWTPLQVSGTVCKLRGYVRYWSDGDKVFAFVKDIDNDAGFPDLASEKALGFEIPPPVEGDGDGEGEGEGEGGAEEEEAAAPEPEPEPAAEVEAAAEGAPAAAEAEDAAPVHLKAPDMCFTLDPHTGAWTSVELAESPVPEPDFETLRAAKIKALSSMGVPDKMVRAMQRPSIAIEDWSIEGVSGRCPSERGGWQHEIVKDKLWVYGGWQGEGKARIFLDDVYCLDMKAKQWTLIYRCEIDAKLGAARTNVMVPGKDAPMIVAMAQGASGAMLEIVETLDVAPMIDPKRTDFKEVMTAHLKESLEDLGKLMTLLNLDLAKGATLSKGDLSTLKKIMGAIKKIKDDGVDLQYQIDQLAETIAYMKVHNMGKLDPLERKHADIAESFDKATSSAPLVRKQIKAVQDEEAQHVKSEVATCEEKFGKDSEKMLRDECFKIACGCSKAYPMLEEYSAAVDISERDCMRLSELCNLFEFPEVAEGIKETVSTMRGNLVKGKCLWDLAYMVDSQIESWKKLLWDDIKPSQLEEDSKAFQKIVKGMDKAVRMWDVYLGIDAQVKNLYNAGHRSLPPSRPLASALCAPGLHTDPRACAAALCRCRPSPSSSRHRCASATGTSLWASPAPHCPSPTASLRPSSVSPTCSRCSCINLSMTLARLLTRPIRRTRWSRPWSSSMRRG